MCEAGQQKKGNSKCSKSFLRRANSFKIFIIILFNLTLYNITACLTILLEAVNCGGGEKLNISWKRLSISTC